MNVDDRNRLVDAYYGGLDDDDPDAAVSAFAPGVTYRYPGEGAIEGREAVRRFFAERRPTSDTTHDVTRRVHGDSATACDGRFEGDHEERGRVEADFAGFFEFDEDESLIAEIAVYSRS